MNGDADGTEKSAEELQLKLITQQESKINSYIYCMIHMVRKTTADALPNIIEYLKEQGYKFKTIK